MYNILSNFSRKSVVKFSSDKPCTTPILLVSHAAKPLTFSALTVPETSS
jgi:hypothetical protein